MQVCFACAIDPHCLHQSRKRTALTSWTAQLNNFVVSVLESISRMGTDIVLSILFIKRRLAHFHKLGNVLHQVASQHNQPIFEMQSETFKSVTTDNKTFCASSNVAPLKRVALHTTKLC